jgi:3-oxoacyl-[acyl-carrier-protein] synthase II
VTDAVVITGIGIVGPGAFGRAAIVGSFPELPGVEEPPRVPDFALEEHLEGGRAFRRVSGATKFALAAMGLAVGDAGFSPKTFGGPDAGIIVGLTHGGAPYSVRFHRELMLEGCLAASPLHFSESVPNAPAGNAAIAFQARGPVHTLIGEEPVGTQAVEMAAALLRSGRVRRCLVAGTEEWSEVVTHAYTQIDRARRTGPGSVRVPPLSEGAAALVLELASTAAERPGTAQAILGGWRLDRCPGGGLEDAMASAVRDAFAGTGRSPAEADHILPPSGRFRPEAVRACAAARGAAAAPATWLDLGRGMGNPVGAANLLQMATSAALISAGKVNGPGLVLSTGITGTLSAVVLCRASGAEP